MSWREALSNLNPFDFANAAPAVRAPHNSGERDPSVMPDYAGAATFPRGFDPDAFMASIEDPRPLFLQDCENAIRELLRSSGEAA